MNKRIANAACELSQKPQFSLDLVLPIIDGGASSASERATALLVASQAYLALRQPEKAEWCLREIIGLDPENIDVRIQLVESLGRQNKSIQAFIELEYLEILLGSNQAPIELECWIARTYFELGDNVKARDWCQRALEKDPENSLLYNLAGCIALASQRTKEALTAFSNELRLDPLNARTHLNISVALRQARSHERALYHLERAQGLDPDHFTDLTGLYYVSSILMDVDKKQIYGDQLLKKYADKNEAKDPFTFFMLTDDPAKIRTANENYARNYPVQTKRFAPIIYPKSIIKIGYASSDFKDHATAFLMRDLIKQHDRKRVEVIALDFSQQSKSGFQSDFVNRFDQRFDLNPLSDSAAAKLIRELEIDVLVDLKGYTEGARPGIFARRPCRTQINYLGYPGTLGSDAYDYIIGDSIVTPKGTDSDYTESVIELSCCYQPNDPDRILGPISSLDQHGLPSDAFIFCSFNYHKKLNGEVFRSWARILKACPDSILWVLGTDNNDKFVDNLHQFGISRHQVIIAPKMPMPNHVERIRHASIFLDSFPCGAHTTASDALFSNVPVVTIQGRAFHSRVAASIMSFAGAPECVASDWHQYEQIACDLYNAPGKLESTMEKLSDKTSRFSPYNTATLADQLETAFARAIAADSPGRIQI